MSLPTQARISALKSAEAERVLGKRLPYNIEAERAVLGSLMLNDEYLSLVREILQAGDFYAPAHRLLYEVFCSLQDDQKRVDVLTVQDVLSTRGELEAIGGVTYLVSLQEDISALGMIEQYARLIKDKAVLRELITSATSIIQNCYTQDDQGIEQVLDQAEKTVFDIANKRTKQTFVQLDIWLKKTFKQLSEMKTTARGITGVPSGYDRLDEMTSGFQKGDFIVLAARPSMGKTALALSMAQSAARAGQVVGFFSLEMGAEQLALRMLSADARVQHHRIRNGTVSADEWVELTHAAARLAEYKLFIDDTPMQTVMDVRAKARKLKLEHNVQFMIVDYLQLLHGSRRFENRHQEVSDISRSLKALAKELEIPILALSQLSRAVESRVDKRPMLSDLRESGAIEQDADLIMFLYRDIVYNQNTEDPSLSEVIIGKQRNGPTGTVHIRYMREFTSFEDTIQQPEG